MLRFIRAAALAAIAVLTLSVTVLAGTGTAHAAKTPSGTAYPAGSTVTVELIAGEPQSNCAATLRYSSDGTNHRITQRLNLDANGNGKTTFRNLANRDYRASAQCPGVTGSIPGLPKIVTVNDTVPVNQCVVAVRDIAWAFGLRGGELAVVVDIARQLCPR